MRPLENRHVLSREIDMNIQSNDVIEKKWK